VNRLPPTVLSALVECYVGILAPMNLRRRLATRDLNHLEQGAKDDFVNNTCVAIAQIPSMSLHNHALDN